MDMQQIEETILATMQTAFEADPGAMRALVVNRVPCSQALADHASIVVSPIPVEGPARFELGAVGLLVGIMSDMGCQRVIAWKFEKCDGEAPDQQMKFVGFALVDKS